METRIRELRKTRGLSLKQIAERIGTSGRQLSRWERGQPGLSLEWMGRIAAALDCRLADLLSAEDHDLDEEELGCCRRGLNALG